MARGLSNALMTGVLAAAVVLTWYWGRPPAEVPDSRASGGDPERGYYLRDAVMRNTDENGGARYDIHAGAISERPAQRVLEMRDVRIEYHEQPASQWSISAAEGLVSIDGRRFELSGGVELQRDGSDGARAASLVTERLLLDLEGQKVTTDAAVTLRDGRNIVSAIGMSAFLMEDRVELESNVHVRVQP